MKRVIGAVFVAALVGLGGAASAGSVTEQGEGRTRAKACSSAKSYAELSTVLQTVTKKGGCSCVKDSDNSALPWFCEVTYWYKD